MVDNILLDHVGPPQESLWSYLTFVKISSFVLFCQGLCLLTATYLPLVIGTSMLNITILAKNLDVTGIGLVGSQITIPPVTLA